MTDDKAWASQDFRGTYRSPQPFDSLSLSVIGKVLGVPCIPINSERQRPVRTKYGAPERGSDVSRYLNL